MNTDFIDDSAEVDTPTPSHVKILLADAIRNRAIPASGRHELLNEMTDEVANLVLRRDYGRNMALAVGQAPGPLPAARARAVPAQAHQGQAAQRRTGRAAERRRSPSAGPRAAG